MKVFNKVFTKVLPKVGTKDIVLKQGVDLLPTEGLLFKALAPSMTDSIGLSTITLVSGSFADLMNAEFSFDSGVVTLQLDTLEGGDVLFDSADDMTPIVRHGYVWYALLNTSFVWIGLHGIAGYVTDQSANAIKILKYLNTYDISQAVAPSITSPLAIKQPRLWLTAKAGVADGGVACVNIGDAVGSWADQSGHGLAPIVSAPKPTFDPTGINGHPGVQFNANSFFRLPEFFTTDFNNNITVFVVATANGGVVEPERMLFGGSTPLWLGIRTASAPGIDITHSGVTPSIAPFSSAGYFNPDGVYVVSVSATEGRFEHDRVFGVGDTANNMLSCEQADSGKTVTGAMTFANQDLYISGYSAGASAYRWSGLIGAIIVYDDALTPEEIRQVYDYLAAEFGFHAKPLVVCAGDSLTSGTGSTSGSTQRLLSTGNNYPCYLKAALGLTADVRTDAYPGRRLDQLLTQTIQYGDLMLCPSTGQKHIQIVWCLTNTLVYTQLVDDTYRQLVTYCQTRRSLGWRVIVATCTPRSPLPYPAFETDRVALNVRILSDYARFADAVLDLTTDARLENPLDSTYYYTDFLHLKSAGYQIVASLAEPVVRSLI